jgi:hypothetical protein
MMKNTILNIENKCCKCVNNYTEKNNLNYHCNLNVSDNDGLTPLHYVAYYNQSIMFYNLVRSDIHKKELNFNLIDQFGNTALHYGIHYLNIVNIALSYHQKFDLNNHKFALKYQPSTGLTFED